MQGMVTLKRCTQTQSVRKEREREKQQLLPPNSREGCRCVRCERAHRHSGASSSSTSVAEGGGRCSSGGYRSRTPTCISASCGGRRRSSVMESPVLWGHEMITKDCCHFAVCAGAAPSPALASVMAPSSSLARPERRPRRLRADYDLVYLAQSPSTQREKTETISSCVRGS